MTVYRDALPGDRRFIRGTWASSYKNARQAGIIGSDEWPAIMHPVIDRLLDRPTTRTIVAAEPTGGFLYGFIAGDTSGVAPIVHYVYVKEPYRSQQGADGQRSGPRHARALFAALGVDPAQPFLYSCDTPWCFRLRDKIPRAKCNPAPARYANYHQHEPRSIPDEQ